ncbi:MAG: segregation/condensation protein A [Vicinamibacterales bacterium]
MSTDERARSPEFESQLESIPLRLEQFEGPLDLLLHLIKKNEVSIYDIPIALITEQYLAYLGLMEELNLDVASEFLVTAATLIHIKSRQLLPRPPTADETGGEEIDPRDALVQRLLDHQRFKAAAELLHERETLRNAQWTRPDARIEAIAGEEVEPELDVDLFGLLAAFRRVLERARTQPAVPLPPEQISIERRIEQLLERLETVEACGFEDLFDDVAGRGDLIVTFLALLEMIRLKLVRAFQQGGGPIRVYRRARPADAPHPIHDPEDEFKLHHTSEAVEASDVPPPSGVRFDEADAPTPDVGDEDEA